MVDDLRRHVPLLNNQAITGREGEQTALRELLSRLLDGQGNVALVNGEAGIGKTTLVRALLAEATTFDVWALSGACFEYDLPAPYALWVEALRSISPAHPGDTQDLLSPQHANSKDELYRSVLARLARLAADRPLLLVLEDLQWADESSLELLRLVARQYQALPVLLVATYRDVDLAPEQPFNRFLPSFIRETQPRRMALRPLGDGAIKQLIECRYVLPSQDDRQRLVEYLIRYGEGNPFFIEELLGLLEYLQVLRQQGDLWTLGDLPPFPVPPLVRQVIDSRLTGLSDASMRLLEIASVVGVDVPLDLWKSISGATDDDLSAVIEEALQERVIEEMPDASGYRFRHALIHGVVYERPNALRRRDWHRRTAEQLAGIPAVDPGVVAHHFSQAADKRAAEWFIQAGRLAGRSFALKDATANYLRALEFLDTDDTRIADRTWLLCALAEANRYVNINDALIWINRAYNTLDQLDDPPMRVLTIWCRARIRGFNHENVLDDLRQAAAAYEELTPEERERILQTSLRYVVSPATSAQEMAGYGQFTLARQYAEAFFREHLAAESGAEMFEFGNAWLGLGHALAALGDPDGARQAFASSSECFLKIDNYQLASICTYWLLSTVAQVYDADRPEVRRRLQQEEILTNRGSELVRTTPVNKEISTSETLILDGKWADCRRSATAREHVSASWVPSARKLIHLDWLQGFPGRAIERIQAVLPLGPDEPPGKRMFVHLIEIQWIAAEIALDANDLPLARRWIEALELWMDWGGKVSGRHVPELLWSRYHELSGDHDGAGQHALAALELAGQPRQPLGLISAQRMLGHLETVSGKQGRAAPYIAEALNLARACEAPYEIARTLLVQAEMLHASGLNGDAQQVLVEARAIAAHLEAAPLLGEIETLVVALSSPVQTRAEVPFGLSPRELEVLGYVARGFTDARIAEELSISPRTVGGHLQSILNKTGTASRTAATALAYQHGLFTTDG